MNNQTAQQSNAAFSSNPPSSVKACPIKHAISVLLRRGGGEEAPYDGERCEASLTDRPDDGPLPANGKRAWSDIPCGICEFRFPSFLKAGRAFAPRAFPQP